jgi:hypothetical protein
MSHRFGRGAEIDHWRAALRAADHERQQIAEAR